MEMLAAIIILSLVAGGLIIGVVLSHNQYKNSIRQSEANELYNTICTLLTNELKFTNQLDMVGDKVVAFKSISYQIKEGELCRVYILDSDGEETNEYGYIALGNDEKKNYVVGQAAYTKGLGAKVKITYDSNNKLFIVDLDIGYDNKTVINNKFDVRALNRIIGE